MEIKERSDLPIHVVLESLDRVTPVIDDENDRLDIGTYHAGYLLDCHLAGDDHVNICYELQKGRKLTGYHPQ
jgi:hypothetical protein